MPNPNESGDSREGREIIGEYNDLYFGDPAINGHIDSPHAENIDPETIESIVSTRSFRGEDGRELMPPRSQKIIYANKRVRRLLFSRGKRLKWKDIPAPQRDGFLPLTIEGVDYMVKKSRFDFATNERQSLIVHESNKAQVVRFLKSKSEGDLMTGEIAKDAHESHRATVIVSKISRQVGDVNRAPRYRAAFGAIDPEAQQNAIEEYRDQKKEALKHGKHFTVDANGRTIASAPYLHIALHGKKDFSASVRGDADIIIGTLRGKTCSADVQQWFESALQAKLALKGVDINDRAPVIKSNTRMAGDMTKIEGRKAHSDKYNTIQLEICRHIRDQFTGEMAEILTELLREFTEKFVNHPESQVEADTSQRRADVSRQVRNASETGPDVIGMIQTSIWSEGENRILIPQSDTIYLNESMRNLLGMNVGDNIVIPQLDGSILKLKIEKARRPGEGLPYARIIVRDAHRQKVADFFKEKMR